MEHNLCFCRTNILRDMSWDMPCHYSERTQTEHWSRPTFKFLLSCQSVFLLTLKIIHAHAWMHREEKIGEREEEEGSEGERERRDSETETERRETD